MDTKKRVYLDPTIDFVFRALFGSEENKDILISLLNSVIQPSAPITDVFIKSPFNLATYETAKESIVDIKAVDQNGNWYDIEMQNFPHAAYVKRASYYLAKVHVEQLSSGQHFSSLNTSIGIHFLNFRFFDDDRMVHRFVPKEIETNESPEEFKILQWHFVELGKLRQDWAESGSKLEQWVAFFQNAERIAARELEDPMIMKALDKLERMAADPHQREIYEAEEKTRMATAAELEYAREYGLRIGRQQGLQEGRQEARMEGLQEGRMDLLIRLITRHIGDVPPNVSARIKALGIEQLDALAEDLFDLHSYDDVEDWFTCH